VLGWVRESSLTTDQMIAKAIATKMASKDKKDKSAISTDATIANYQSQTQQIKDMKWVLICAIVAGTSLMMLSVIAPFIIVGWLHASFFITSFSKANQTSVLNTVDKLASTPGAVLPLATGLVGFAGGVVTAMFRTSTTSTRTRWSRNRWSRNRWSRNRWSRNRWSRNRWSRNRWSRNRWSRNRLHRS